MADKPLIAVFADDGAQRAYLDSVLSQAGCVPAHNGEEMTAARLAVVVSGASGQQTVAKGQRVLLLGGEPRGEEGVRVLPIPVRAADLIAAIDRVFTVDGAGPDQIDIAGHVLDTRESLWRVAGKEPVRLTEKEVAILSYLKESEPLAIPRAVLLEKVWAYAEGVETHTLETHIYRLRQKIEADPSRPEILLTVEDGYKIGS